MQRLVKRRNHPLHNHPVNWIPQDNIISTRYFKNMTVYRLCTRASVLIGLGLLLLMCSSQYCFKPVSSQSLVDSESQSFFSKTNLASDFSYPDIYPNRTQDLLDFAVAGFAKCGTTFLMRDVLGLSDHVYMGYQNARGQYKEMHQLENRGQLPQFLTYFQSQSLSPTIKRGFKAPNTLMFDEALIHLSTYFPKTKLIVSVRHPILWFQSNYNYKMRLEKYAVDPEITPHNRIGECKGGITNAHGCTVRQSCVTYKPGFGCTDLSNFHIHLSRLGWTPRNTTRELSLLHHRTESTFDFSQSSMFLMELGQLDPRKNSTGTEWLISDLETFLGMEKGSLPKIQPPKDTGTSKHVKKADGNEQVLSRMIHICDDEYKDVRTVLLQQAQDASEWIQEFFLKSSHVVVSNTEYFIQLLNQWKVDPCVQYGE